MDILDLREYILSFYDAEESTPFDDVTLVYKVGGKMFACASMDDFSIIVIHHNPEIGEVLRDKYPQITPAWHFNKRYWSSVRVDGDLPDALVRELIRESYIFTIHHNVTPKARREELLRMLDADTGE